MTQPLKSSPGSVAADSLLPGEFTLSRDDFRRISQMIYSDAGIHLTEGKAALVYARLAKRLRALRMQAFRDYCDLVSSPEGSGERQEMLTALTTNVTKFFREPHHFEHLKTKILTPFLAQAGRSGRLRLWSAACSTGQEPYTIALTLLSIWPEAANHDVKILATDIDRTVLATAEAGIYGEEQLEGNRSDATLNLPRGNQARCWILGTAGCLAKRVRGLRDPSIRVQDCTFQKEQCRAVHRSIGRRQLLLNGSKSPGPIRGRGNRSLHKRAAPTVGQLESVASLKASNLFEPGRCRFQ